MAINNILRLSVALMLGLAACNQKASPSAQHLLERPSVKYETVAEAPQDRVVTPTKKDDTDQQALIPPSGATPYPPSGLMPQGQNPNLPPMPPPMDGDEFPPSDILGEGPPIAPYSRCGNGRREPLEQCDLGEEKNETNMDGCNIICGLPFCGNGVTEPPHEACDDGNREDGDGCSSRCQFERCGNFILDDGEECDDGNKAKGDGCSACCKYERCGNSIIDPKEECDDGNTANGDGCSDCCLLEADAKKAALAKRTLK